nr:hypothetical protein [Rhodococcus sp. 15-1154-1]
MAWHSAAWSVEKVIGEPKQILHEQGLVEIGDYSGTPRVREGCITVRSNATSEQWNRLIPLSRIIVLDYCTQPPG